MDFWSLNKTNFHIKGVVIFWLEDNVLKPSVRPMRNSVFTVWL